MNKKIQIRQDSKKEDFLEIVKEMLENLGVEYKESGEGTITYKCENNSMKVYDQLGFPIDLNEILRRLKNDNEEFYDELYSFGDIKFTSVSLPPKNNKTNKWIVFKYEVYNPDYGTTFNGFSIKIDNKGRVFSNIPDSPWEDGGISDEIESIIDKYISEIIDK